MHYSHYGGLYQLYEVFGAKFTLWSLKCELGSSREERFYIVKFTRNLSVREEDFAQQSLLKFSNDKARFLKKACTKCSLKRREVHELAGHCMMVGEKESQFKEHLKLESVSYLR